MPLAVLIILLLPAAGRAQDQSSAASPPLSRAEKEEFLRNAAIASERELYPRTLRVSLDDGKRKHDATIQIVDSGNPSSRDVIRLSVAACLLDKALELNLVQPCVERTVKGQAAVVTWWADGTAMSEQERRRRNIDPPDVDGWNKQMQAVRVFDELISNSYRSTSPEFYLTTLWDNLLITRDWKISLTDHKAAFRIARQLENPASLVRCDRTLLARLRELKIDTVRPYLTPEELDGLESRRQLLVKHFDEQIALRGESAVLYDLPPRP